MTVRTIVRFLAPLWAAMMLALSPQAALAQGAPAATEAAAPAASAATAANDNAAKVTDAVVYKPLGPEWIKGQPTVGGVDVQKQYSPIGITAEKFHFALVWVMVLISAFVLVLMLYVMWRFRASKNPVPSKTTHNTLIEVVWTLVPVLILVGIALPSIHLLSIQYKSPPKDALTIKVTGYQWYWGYTYPDNGGFEVISNMLPDAEAVKRGLPAQLAVDNRMVVPAGEWIRLQTTGADVIHSFAVPSLWFKLDAVPGRLNERRFYVDQPGIYYGQCSELCGSKHGYMPIAVEAVPRAQFDAWIKLQGGTIDKAGLKADPAAAAAEAAKTDASATASDAPADAKVAA
nr:cytochrome c oxidase subunit II [Tsuneonella mangrovi]